MKKKRAECHNGNGDERMDKILEGIKMTNGGYLVKDLRYKSITNIIVGLVRDPIFGKEWLHDGYISIQWNRNGFPININKGRKDLKISINYEEEDIIQDR